MSQLFYPEDVSTGRLLTELGEELVRQGVDVSAIAGQPSYYEFRRVSAELRHAGMRIERPPISTAFRKGNLLGRLVNLVTYVLGLLFMLLFRREKGPLLIVTNPPFLGIVGYLCKQIHGARYILLVHDVYPDVLPHFGICSENSLLVRVWHAMNRRIYGSADRIIVLGRHMKDIIAAKVDSKDIRENITVIPNWADVDLVQPKPKSESRFYETLDLGDELVLLYSGNKGMLHNVEMLIRAMERLTDKPVHLMFIGGGQKEQSLKELVREKGLGNVSFHPYQPQDMIGESLVACDVQLAVLDSPFTGLAVPCKLYGMLASGKPAIVVCEEQGEMARVVEELECGFVVSPGDVDGLVDAISRLMSDDSLRKQMGRRARQACVRQYTLAEVAGRYVNVIRSVQDCYRATK